MFLLIYVSVIVLYFYIDKTAAFIATVVAVDCGASSIKNKKRQVNSTTGVL